MSSKRKRMIIYAVIQRFLYNLLWNLLRKQNFYIDFLWRGYYDKITNTNRGSDTVKTTSVRCQSLTREWGKENRSPAWPIPCAFRKRSVGESQSLGEILRRQDRLLFEARVGKPTGSLECCFQNGCGDVLWLYISVTVFYFNWIWFPVAGQDNGWLPGLKENGVWVPALPAL